ncbi:MAG: hypothetical protein IPL90_12270 [Holophagales bacterium]|nr:hypothetical protein [Holophagales bacterium]
MTPARLASIVVSLRLPRTPEVSADSKTTTAYPMPRQETRKRSGRKGVDQKGWSFAPVRSMTVPSDDWCIVGRRIPRAMSHGSALSTIGAAFSEVRFRNPGGPSATSP